jgi:uncharacterized membrane protein YeaQ/YmgE (transglycosylase-associated protein family)
MGIIGWIVVGLIVGAIAKLLMPGRDPGGMIITIGLGIAGAIVGGAMGRALGFYDPPPPVSRDVRASGGAESLGAYWTPRRRTSPSADGAKRIPT